MTSIISLDDVTKRFGGLVAVKNLSFDLVAGESLGLIGPNGAGKTTAFGILMGEHRPDSGQVRFRGEDITRLATHARVRRGIARTYQIPRPFGEMSVLENIRAGSLPNELTKLIFGREPSDSDREILRSVGFDERQANALPDQLAMGDLRKLELARMLATKPQVMLLDEVFAGLTVGEIAQLTELLLDRKRQGMTSLVVSHDLRSLKPLVDRVIAMSFGSVIAEGAFDEVLADRHVREAYLGTVDDAAA